MGVLRPIPVLSNAWGYGSPDGVLRPIPQIRGEKALGLLNGHALSSCVVLDLIASQAADHEITRFGMSEIEARDARGRRHGKALRQRHTNFLGAEELEELLLLAV